MHEHQSHNKERQADADDRKEDAVDHEGAQPFHPRIYVASLSDYNNGRLHGAWIDAAQDERSLHRCIQEMLRASPCPGAEEWAIHDYDGFDFVYLSESESLHTVSRIARGIARHGRAFAAWASEVGVDSPDLDQFEDVYLGRWESGRAFAEEMLDELGCLEDFNRHIPEHLAPYITFDYESFINDLVFNGDISTVEDSDGSVFVFQS